MPRADAEDELAGPALTWCGRLAAACRAAGDWLLDHAALVGLGLAALGLLFWFRRNVLNVQLRAWAEGRCVAADGGLGLAPPAVVCSYWKMPGWRVP